MFNTRDQGHKRKSEGGTPAPVDPVGRLHPEDSGR